MSDPLERAIEVDRERRRREHTRTPLRSGWQRCETDVLEADDRLIHHLLDEVNEGNDPHKARVLQMMGMHGHRLELLCERVHELTVELRAWRQRQEDMAKR